MEKKKLIEINENGVDKEQLYTEYKSMFSDNTKVDIRHYSRNKDTYGNWYDDHIGSFEININQ